MKSMRSDITRWATLVLLCLLPTIVRGQEAATETPASDEKVTANEADDYYRLYTMLADAIAQVESNYVKPIEREKIFAAAVRGVMRELDPYSNFIEADDFDEFREEVESQFGGVGMQVTVDRGGRLTVISPLVGTPAYRAGIRAGDRIMEIDGQSTEEMTLQDAVDLMKGRSGTSVRVKIARRGRGEPIEHKIVRERIHVETVLGFERGDDDRWEFLAQTDPPIGYVRLTAFSRDTAEEVKRALTKMTVARVKGIVLDLRFNPGGLLTSAVDVADLFIDEGLIVATDGRNIERKEWEAHSRDALTDVPMAILVNRYSASASEVVSACLQDHKRAIVVGERTWGKGSVQNIVELDGGQGALKLTTAAYHRPSGKNIHRFPDAKDDDDWGVMPDEGFKIEFSPAELRRLDASWRLKDIIGPAGDEAAEEVADVDDTETDDGETDDAADELEAELDSFKDRQLEKALEYLRGEISE
jgi:carboxyl-terminal processing protease